jgi:phage baseplate assembly protein W
MTFVNIQFPLADDDITGYFLKQTTTSDAAVKSDLTLLLITPKGTRKYFRDYGTNLRKYLFEQNDNLTQFDIETDIKTTVSKYLPSISITNIVFQQHDDNPYLLTLIVEYAINEGAFTSTDILSITFNNNIV